MNSPVDTSAQIERHIARALDQLKEANNLARHDPYMKARLHEAMNVLGRTLEEVTNKNALGEIEMPLPYTYTRS
jgi:hypothetical protein